MDSDIRILFCMVIGLKEDKYPWCAEKEPFKDHKNFLQEIKPQNKHLKAEIVRHQIAYCLDLKARPAQWKREKLDTWLKSNPIPLTEVDDLAFLKEQLPIWEKNIRDINQADERASEKGRQVLAGWYGSLPYLRLIHCLIHDSVKPKLLTQHAAKSREELDARNSDQAETSVITVIKNLYNDPDFVPESFVLPHVHEEFTGESCGFETIACTSMNTHMKFWHHSCFLPPSESVKLHLNVEPVNEDKIKKKIAKMRAKMLLVSLPGACPVLILAYLDVSYQIFVLFFAPGHLALGEKRQRSCHDRDGP